MFRLLVTASLLHSLAAAGVYPSVAALNVAEAVTPGGGSGKTICCCGTNDGRCCGRACCQTPTPEKDKNPVSPNRSHHDEGQPLAFAVGATKIPGPTAAALRDHLFANGLSCTGGPSLLALSIRLNI
ncbi:MAG: hypothetical protein KY475_27810 [Planctomycetes bacterium]|nr:hypothetical protein [Planctomycetota bacterium]